MADIVGENLLVSKKPLQDLPENWHGKPFVEIVLSLVQEKVRIKNPSQEWMVNAQTGEVLLLKDIIPKCHHIAKILASKGLKEGDVVHLVMANSVDFHVIVFAIWLLGRMCSLISKIAASFFRILFFSNLTS